METDAPEKEKFVGDWKKKDALQRLCMMRALRPDRMIYAVFSLILVLIRSTNDLLIFKIIGTRLH